jgi:hypothetical protein
MLPVGGLRKTGHAHSYELNCQRPTIPARWGIVSHPSPLPKERELVVGGATAPTLAIAPHPSPLPKERELVDGGATVLTLAIVSHPSPLPEERELVVTKTPPSKPPAPPSQEEEGSATKRDFSSASVRLTNHFKPQSTSRHWRTYEQL